MCTIWRDHPNFGWGRNQATNSMSRQQVAQPGFQAQAHNRQLPQEKKLPSEDLIMQMLQNQQVAIQNLENQMGQLANALITRPVGVFPSDTHVPRAENQESKAIMLHSGKELPDLQPSTTLKVHEKEDNDVHEKEVSNEHEDPKPLPPKPCAPKIPYPQRLQNPTQNKKFKQFWRYLKIDN